MSSVGIRELRQHASALIRRVEAGETIEITDRGRPVAILSPRPRTGNRLEQLRAAGDLLPAAADHGSLPPPLPVPPGLEAPAEVLERLRRDER